jgi:hypothetical protein
LGAVGGLLGVGGGAGGTGFSGPGSVNIDRPADVNQANTQYKNAQDALAQQNAFLQATQAQNGLGNQTSVFNQLQGVANGTGPNPAQAQLAQATGANVSNQAALMAGQRGANQNVGLMARQAAQQGAATQQQSAGQAATLQAQQSLNALSGMGNIAGQQAGQQAAATQANTQATQNEQKQILDAIAQQNSTAAGLQANINTVNGGLANTTMQGQQGLLGAAGQGLGSAMHLLAKGGPVQNYAQGQYVQAPDLSKDEWDKLQANPNIQQPAQSPALAQPQIQAQPSAPAQAPKAAQPQASPDFGNQGANNLYKGLTGQLGQQPQNGYKGQSSFGSFLSDLFSSTPKTTPSEDHYGVSGDTPIETQSEYESGKMRADAMPTAQAGQTTQDVSDPTRIYSAEGGKVPAMVSPGEKYLSPKDVQKVAKGANPMEVGEKIPGKPKVSGAKNDYANDTIPKTLEEGGIVLPRSVTQAKHPHWEAHKFVSAIMAKNGGKIK